MANNVLEKNAMSATPYDREREERRREENAELRTLVATIQAELTALRTGQEMMLTKLNGLPCTDHAVFMARIEERLAARAANNGTAAAVAAKTAQDQVDLIGLLVMALKSRVGTATGISAVVVALYEAIKVVVRGGGGGATP